MSGFGDVEELSELSSLERVEKEFMVRAVDIRDFRGLENLRSVGRLKLLAYTELVSFEGLSGLKRVRGDVWMEAGGNRSRRQIRSFLEDVRVDGNVRID